MKKTLTLAVVFGVAVVAATGLTVLFGGSRPSDPSPPPSSSTTNATSGEPPPGKAQAAVRAFDEDAQEAERKKAALLRAQQVAATKVVLVQFRDRLEGVRKLLDERRAEDERWEREVETLLDNDDGRAVVAARRVRDVWTLLGQRKGYELSEQATRTSVDLLLQPVAVALDDGQALFAPDYAVVGQVTRLETLTREPTAHNRDTREAVRRIVEDARRTGGSQTGQGGAGPTLRTAIEDLRAEEVRQRLNVVHARADKRQAEVAELWAARRTKLVQRLGEAKTAEVEAAFKAAPDRERFEQPTPALGAARRTLRDAFGKLEADQVEAEWFTCWRWTLTKGVEDHTADRKAK